MARKVKAVVKLQIEAGEARPTPAVGSALGQYGINMMAFFKEYNERTSDQVGMIVPAEITIYEDRSFSFVTKAPPTAGLIRRELSIEKGSQTPGRETVATITQEQLEAVAKIKMPDLNTADIEAAKRIVAGTARSMGIEVAG